MARPFRFAVQLNGPLAGMTWADRCRTVEGWGYNYTVVPGPSAAAFAPVVAALAGT